MREFDEEVNLAAPNAQTSLTLRRNVNLVGIFRAHVVGIIVAILISLKHDLFTWSNPYPRPSYRESRTLIPREKQAQGKQGRRDDLVESHGWKWQCAFRNGTAETCACYVDHA